MNTKLAGIVPPLITPLTGRDTLDAGGLERLIEHVLRGGVHGVFILGTTGEAPCLSYRLRRELIERTCACVRHRVPVLVGITDTSFEESINLARHAADAGADAAVAAPPYYFPAGQPELYEYITHLTKELPLPVFLYNMPQMTKLVFEIPTLRRCVDIASIIGVKDSSGDLAYFQDVLAVARTRPDWSVLIGPEQLLAKAVSLGGSGGVNGGANLMPELFVALYEAAMRGDTVRVAALQARVENLGRLYQIGRHVSAIIKGLKCALSLQGICDDFMAEPFHRFAEAERARVRELLKEFEALKS